MPLNLPSLRFSPSAGLSIVFVLLIASLLAAPVTMAAPVAPDGNAATNAIAPPEVTAKAIYVMDMTSGVELYTKDPYAHLQVGSVVKIATALVVVNNVELDEQVLIQESDLVDTNEYSNMALQAGDTLTVSQLLYGLMIPSGNDGARALARYVGSKLVGSEDANVATEAFVKEMNAYAASLGLKNSRFTVPDGIDTPNSYTSAYDITILARELMKNDFLRSVVKEPAYRFYSVGPESRLYEKPTTNQRLGQSGVIGVKTGTTGESGGNVVLAREVNGGANIILITIIGSDHAYADEASGQQLVDSRWNDADAIMASMDASFVWAAPNGDGVLPGLGEQMQVWDVQFQDPPAIPVPTGTDITLGYRLQVGAVAEPGARAGALHLYYGDTEVGIVPIYQASASARSGPHIGMAA